VVFPAVHEDRLVGAGAGQSCGARGDCLTCDSRPELTERLGETHQMAGYYGLRPSVFLMLFVERETWRAYLDLEDEE
jgi:hypothetical protein